MKKIFLDTNFLMYSYQFNIDIFEEINRIIEESYEICILDNIIDELNRIITEQKGKDKYSAKFALSLIKKKDIQIIASDKTSKVDDILASLGEDPDNIIATQDIGLKRRLRNKKIITIRQRNHLVIV